MAIRITEIFFSIQGESSYSGLPCIFVRTTGCDLRCVWCDSEYTFIGGVKMTIDEILKQVMRYPSKLVELTGGEPLLQKEIPELASRLLDDGYTVMIETGGHRDISTLDPRIIRIMDIKCPASGESEKNLWSNIRHLTKKDEVKFVCVDMNDYNFAKKCIIINQLSQQTNVLLSVACGIDPSPIVEQMLQDGLKARFQVQLHKIVWPNDHQGR